MSAIGLAIYVWHNDKPRYDEVSWFPGALGEEEARSIGVQKLRSDIGVTKLQLELNGRLIDDFRLNGTQTA